LIGIEHIEPDFPSTSSLPVTTMPSVLGKEVGPIGFGLMGLTWRAKPQPEAESFKTMSHALSMGANYWNGGEMYGDVEGKKGVFHQARI